jgi:hypothetical protein
MTGYRVPIGYERFILDGVVEIFDTNCRRNMVQIVAETCPDPRKPKFMFFLQKIQFSYYHRVSQTEHFGFIFQNIVIYRFVVTTGKMKPQSLGFISLLSSSLFSVLTLDFSRLSVGFWEEFGCVCV